MTISVLHRCGQAVPVLCCFQGFFGFFVLRGSWFESFFDRVRDRRLLFLFWLLCSCRRFLSQCLFDFLLPASNDWGDCASAVWMQRREVGVVGQLVDFAVVRCTLFAGSGITCREIFVVLTCPLNFQNSPVARSPSHFTPYRRSHGLSLCKPRALYFSDSFQPAARASSPDSPMFLILSHGVNKLSAIYLQNPAKQLRIKNKNHW